LSDRSDPAGDPPPTRRVTFAPATLYPIIDGADPTARRPLIDALLEAGVPWLQLRCKGAPASSFLEAAQAILASTRGHATRVIVNDRLDVALASGAAGVHLGQGDLPLAAALRIAGDRLVIGISTHDVAEARAAQDGGADYVGFGPMFPTASKADAHPQRTLDELARVRAAITIPIVAIGGITEATAPSVLAAGADSVAMIGALASADDHRELVRRLLALRSRTP